MCDGEWDAYISSCEAAGNRLVLGADWPYCEHRAMTHERCLASFDFGLTSANFLRNYDE